MKKHNKRSLTSLLKIIEEYEKDPYFQALKEEVKNDEAVDIRYIATIITELSSILH